jgi:hypothetical protein
MHTLKVGGLIGSVAILQVPVAVKRRMFHNFPKETQTAEAAIHTYTRTVLNEHVKAHAASHTNAIVQMQWENAIGFAPP